MSGVLFKIIKDGSVGMKMIQDAPKVAIVEVGIFRFLYNSLFFCIF